VVLDVVECAVAELGAQLVVRQRVRGVKERDVARGFRPPYPRGGVVVRGVVVEHAVDAGVLHRQRQERVELDVVADRPWSDREHARPERDRGLRQAPPPSPADQDRGDDRGEDRQCRRLDQDQDARQCARGHDPAQIGSSVEDEEEDSQRERHGERLGEQSRLELPDERVHGRDERRRGSNPRPEQAPPEQPRQRDRERPEDEHLEQHHPVRVLTAERVEHPDDQRIPGRLPRRWMRDAVRRRRPEPVAGGDELALEVVLDLVAREGVIPRDEHVDDADEEPQRDRAEEQLEIAPGNRGQRGARPRDRYR